MTRKTPRAQHNTATENHENAQQHNLLNTPITLPNGAVIKNRFVKSSMNEAMGTRDMQPKLAIATLYKRWAQGGAGLILTGNVMV